MFSNFLLKIRNKIRVARGNTITIGKRTRIRGSSIFIQGQNNKLIVHDGVRIRNTVIEIIGNDCLIEIGRETLVGHDCYLSAKEKGTALLIGSECALSRNVKLMTSDGHDILQSGKRINPAQNIHIMNQVWLGDGVTILKGVTVGEGSIVGIHSVLTKSIGNYVIAAGNPARVVKEDVSHRGALTY